MRKFNKVLSLISATVMSGICVLSNMGSLGSVNAATLETGLPTPTSEDYQEYMQHYADNQSINDPDVPHAGLFGDSCDLSQSPYFPVIKCQSGRSCALWSTTYYQFTYEANKLNNITTTESNTYSPVYPFSFIGPSYNWQAYDFLKDHGSVKVEDWDLNKNYNIWCDNTDAMVKALKTRVRKDYDTSINTNQASDNLDYIKSLLYGSDGTDGKILAVNTTDFWGWEYKKVKQPSSNAQELVAVRSTTTSDTDAHALTIVGYNDNIWCDMNNNKRRDPGETGAFKVANSHGTSYKNSGYVWVLYDALNKNSELSGWQDTSKVRKPIFEHMESGKNSFYYITVENRDVEFVGQLTINTNYRNSLKLYAGKNSVRRSPSNYKTIFEYDDDSTVAKYNGTLVFDYTDLIDSLESDISGKYWYMKIFGKRNSGSFKITDNFSTKISNIVTPKNGENVVTINTTVGDVNYDGKIDSLDVSKLVEYNMRTIELSDLQHYLGDFDGNGEVSISDVSALSRYVVSSGNTTSNEIKKINRLNNTLKSFMIANNYSKTELSEIERVNELGISLQKRLESMSNE